MKYVADDWGLSREINDAILQLVSLEMIQRVSVLTTSDHSDFRLDELKDSNIEFSLHLDLTYNRVSSSLRSLALRPPPDLVLCREIERQVTEFERLGFRFEYLEAHEYAHCLPSVAHCVSVLEFDNLRGIRKMIDWRHPLAKAGSAICFQHSYKKFAPLEVLEFVPGKLSKIPMVVHPASSNSFDSRDSWRAKRVKEFRTLIESAALQDC
jgi:predicted glycoside hydrolase/deacetylase ChbG (UPF0249 family)